MEILDTLSIKQGPGVSEDTLNASFVDFERATVQMTIWTMKENKFSGTKYPVGDSS